MSVIRALSTHESWVKSVITPQVKVKADTPLEKDADTPESSLSIAIQANARTEDADRPIESKDPLLQLLRSLQEMLRQAEAQLQSAMKASYPSPEARDNAVRGLEAQVIILTQGVQKVASEIAKRAMSGAVVNTRA